MQYALETNSHINVITVQKTHILILTLNSVTKDLQIAMIS